MQLLLAVDAVFVAIHLGHVYSSALQNNLFSIEAERGYAECFQYVKEFGIVIMLAALWRRTGNRLFADWMLLFAYVLADDAFQIHEIGGEIVSRHLGLIGAYGLRGQDFGELVVWGIVGAGFLALLGLAYPRNPPNARHISADMGFLFAVLVFLGVGIDMAHSTIGNPTLRVAFGLLEDGGEMITVSVICWYVARLLARCGVAPARFGLRGASL